MMQGNGRLDQIAAQRTQPRKRPLLVGTGELAVSGLDRHHLHPAPRARHPPALRPAIHL
jgi:hypothetical protein